MIKINAKECSAIELGYQGENLARCVYFDISEMATEFGAGTVSILVQRFSETESYEAENVSFEINGDTTYAIWTLTDKDTAMFGRGYCQLRYLSGNVVCKTVVYRTNVAESLKSAE